MTKHQLKAYRSWAILLGGSLALVTAMTLLLA
jgi:hypothetical protein